MRIGIKTTDTYDSLTLDGRIDFVRSLAEAGFASVYPVSHSDWDTLTDLALVGRMIVGVRLGTSIIQTFPRHPLILASQALSVQAATGNRLTLGIGPGAEPLIEGTFGLPYDAPARHSREFLSVLMPLLRGEPVSHDGESFRVEGSVSMPGADAPTVLLSALGPVMLRIAGEMADGTITTWTGPRSLESHIVPTITAAAEAAGRPRPRVVAEAVICVTDDSGATRTYIDEQFGFFTQLPSYRAMLEREGAERVSQVAIIGDAEEVQRQIQRYASAGVSELVAVPFGPEADRDRTIEVLAALARSAQ